MIPGLSEAALITFYESCQRSAKAPMDEAVSALEGLLELSQHHPALAPEIAILRKLCTAWWAVVPAPDTCRLARFELGLDLARQKPLPDALAALDLMRSAFAQVADLAADLRRLATICDAWTDLQASDVMERGRNN